MEVISRPSKLGELAAINPTEPLPKIAGLLPCPTPAFSTVWLPVGSMHHRYSTCSSRSAPGIFTSSVLAADTRTYSACPPATVPYS